MSAIDFRTGKQPCGSYIRRAELRPRYLICGLCGARLSLCDCCSKLHHEGGHEMCKEVTNK